MHRRPERDAGAPLADRCREAVSRYQMLTEGDSLVVGLSGGADSVALVHLLRSFSGELQLRLTAAHLNHRLRGEESLRDERFVKSLCRDLGIPLVVEAADVAGLARERGLSVETCAREERYAFFHRVAGPGKIATAHTLDDNAETVLLHLVRGAGLRGLCGIPPVRGRIVRPLILCARAEVEAYCAARGLSYVTDSSNQDDRFTRNRVRRQVLPVLKEMNPAFLRGVSGMADALRADADYLDSLAARAGDAVRLGGHRYDAAALLGQPAPLRRRLLLEMLGELGLPRDRRRVETLECLLREGGRARLSGSWDCVCSKGKLAFFPVYDAPPAAMDPVELVLSFGTREVAVFSDKKMRMIGLDLEIYKKNKNFSENHFENALDYDKIDGIVKFRQRLPGDRIRLAGRGCTKELRKLYNEAGLTARQRERTMVLAGEDGPLWVEGFGAAQSVCVDDGTRRVLLLEALE